MKDAKLPTLSSHLLDEAKRFLGYPRRIYRTKSRVEDAARLHRIIAELLPWRSPFTPESLKEAVAHTIKNKILVDEIYCRELLGEIPQFVRRTGALAALGLEDITPGRPLVYLQEATRTYIAGFFRAAIALARAALEAGLKERLTDQFGSAEAELDRLIDFAFNVKIVSQDAHAAAHRIRAAGNRVLHTPDAKVDDKDGLSAVEDARRVLLEILAK